MSKSRSCKNALQTVLCACLSLLPHSSWSHDASPPPAAGSETGPAIALEHDGDRRTYTLSTKIPLRYPALPGNRITFAETTEHAKIRTGNLLFDGLYAMAVSEALANSVSEISDSAYDNGVPVKIDAFQTGEFWKYVWTRDLSYSVYLALADFDPPRSVHSLLFKTSTLKPSVKGGLANQIIQDTGSGGSYPVSTDRIVWALGASETLKHLPEPERQAFLEKIYPILHDTIEQDRVLVFDARDGLYRGEQSFLDWREQTYPGWTKANVLAIGMSKALSVNAANYFLLATTADYARLLGKPDAAERYAQWAGELKAAINSRFFDDRTGLYSTYLLSDDGGPGVRLPRYDLLGESLAILVGVADQARAETIIRRYPTGPAGPPVVWPQERSVPIYHNQAIWPFVTAFWIKAARQAGNAAAVDAGIASLQQLAAANLSNMENFDLISGRAEVSGQARNGPEINSRRQLWSVAGYLAMVQDVVFGLETSWDGVRVRPFVTARLRNTTFGSSEIIEMRDWSYLGTRNRVRVHLPAVSESGGGACGIDRAELNGNPIDGDVVKRTALRRDNTWEIYLKAPALADPAGPLTSADVSSEPAIFAPVQPQWRDDVAGLTLKDGRLVLNYLHDDPANVTFNIYRDGRLCAEGVRELQWTDPNSDDYQRMVHSYAVSAVDLRSGNVSHLTPSRAYRGDEQHLTIPASSLQNRGGNLVAGHHFENWGKPEDELVTNPLQVMQAGRYALRVEFSERGGSGQHEHHMCGEEVGNRQRRQRCEGGFWLPGHAAVRQLVTLGFIVSGRGNARSE